MKTGRKSWYLAISLLIIIGGYIVIFSSSYLSSNRQGDLLTEIGKSVDYNSHFFTVESWSYSELQELMEVCIKVDNMSFDGNDTYYTDVKARKGKNLKTEVVANTRDLLVVHISNVPENFDEIGLRVFYDKETEKTPLKLYMNQKDVTRVDSIEIKTVEMYYIERNNNIIESYQADIESNNNEIAALNVKIENAQIAISDLRDREQYKTDTEKAIIEQNIVSINAEISDYERQILIMESENSENNIRIENCKRENDALLNSIQK